MLIKNWMSQPVVTIGPDVSMQGAKELMENHDIRTLPVVDSKKMIGILSDGDLKSASASNATCLDIYELNYLLRKIRIATIMTRDPVSIRANMTLAEAAEIFLSERISVLPVMDNQVQLVGIISPSDLSRAFLSLMAHDEQGFEIAVQVEDRPGITVEIAACIRKAHGRIASLISTEKTVPQGFRQIYLRLYGLDRRELIKLSMSLGDIGILLYIVDHTHHRRNIFAAA